MTETETAVEVEVLDVPESLAMEMAAHALAEAPDECCGIVGGKDGKLTTVYPAINGEPSAAYYLMDATDQLRIFNEMDKAGEELMVIFHSHPHHEPVPSLIDTHEASYPDAVYIICSLAGSIPLLRGWRIIEEQATEIQLVLVEEETA